MEIINRDQSNPLTTSKEFGEKQQKGSTLSPLGENMNTKIVP